MWNLNKEEGWENYYSLTENNTKLANIAANYSDPTKVMKVIENEFTKAKFKAFGKITYNQSAMNNKKIKALMKVKSDA